MNEIRKFIKKRYQIDDNFSRGFMFYCLKVDYDDYTIDKILKMVDEIKKDFPNVTNEQIEIVSYTKGELVLSFFCLEIPNDMHFEKFKG